MDVILSVNATTIDSGLCVDAVSTLQCKLNKGEKEREEESKNKKLTNNDSGIVSNTSSLFDYKLTNTSYAAQNPTSFTPYLPTNFSSPSLQRDAIAHCDYLFSNLSQNCVLNYSRFYESCVYDVQRSSRLEDSEPSAAAYARMCDVTSHYNECT